MKELIDRLSVHAGYLERYRSGAQRAMAGDIRDAIAALEAAEAREAELRDALRAKTANSDNPVILPDGSAFSILSLPLPEDHWLYAEYEYELGALEPKELPAPILIREVHKGAVVAAVRYAIRGATRCGREPEFDPDAMVQNAVYALCGPCSKLLTEEKGK